MAMGPKYDHPHWDPISDMIRPSHVEFVRRQVSAESIEKAANECKFRVGDVVRLMSGGPFMTVVDVDGWYVSFTCGWFDMRHAYHTAIFSERVLFAVPA